MTRVSIVDSHTGGEPTRVVVSGGPELGGGTVADKLEAFRKNHDRFRSAVVNEPRGSDVLVGAILVESAVPGCVAGAIFFNNVGYLGMCGHGIIGLVTTLAHLKRIRPGEHRIETPVGVVTATLQPSGEVRVFNVSSWRAKKGVTVKVPDLGLVTGDIAWGGNWFYLAEDHGQELSLLNVERLTEVSWRIRQALNGNGHAEVDHIELFGRPLSPAANARSFVQCPGKAYDRSPCGTGTSAKLACLAADGKLDEDATWVQESIIGSTFMGSFKWQDRQAGKILPCITGTAFVNAESALLLDERDPFCWGIRG